MKFQSRLLVVLLIVVPAFLRSLQVEWNMVPIGAMALFAGAHFRNRTLAFAIPLLSMVLGDVLLGLKHGDVSFYTFHSLVPLVYGCYAVSALMGMGLRRYWDGIEAADSDRPAPSPFATRFAPIAGTTLAGALMFYLVTNLGDWWAFDSYPKTWAGLRECYTAALPYFGRTVLGDVIGAILLFGGEHLAQSQGAPAAESEQLF